MKEKSYIKRSGLERRANFCGAHSQVIELQQCVVSIKKFMDIIKETQAADKHEVDNVIERIETLIWGLRDRITLEVDKSHNNLLAKVEFRSKIFWGALTGIVLLGSALGAYFISSPIYDMHQDLKVNTAAMIRLETNYEYIKKKLFVENKNGH